MFNDYEEEKKNKEHCLLIFITIIIDDLQSVYKKTATHFNACKKPIACKKIKKKIHSFLSKIELNRVKSNLYVKYEYF